MRNFRPALPGDHSQYLAKLGDAQQGVGSGKGALCVETAPFVGDLGCNGKDLLRKMAPQSL